MSEDLTDDEQVELAKATMLATAKHLCTRGVGLKALMFVTDGKDLFLIPLRMTKMEMLSLMTAACSVMESDITADRLGEFH